MKVVVVNETVPYPPNAGNRVRTLNLMQRLALRHQITYVCRGSDSDAETHAAKQYLADRGVAMVVADAAPPAKSGMGFYARLGRNLLSSMPYAVAAHNSPPLRRMIRAMALREKVDVWQFEWLAYADALNGIEGVRRVVIAHNVESLIWQRYAEAERNPLRKLYFLDQWRKFRAYEKRVFASVEGVVCVSEEDHRLARDHFSPRQAWVVDNGIDKAYFQQARAVRDPRTILFLGSLEWRPNLDGVRLLLDRIFPSVLKMEPQARLCIVGRRAPQWLRDRISRSPSIELYSDVADVRPYLAKASVMAVPLRVGGGSRLKILEALACGLPVVSTPVGYEGLCLVPGRHIIIAERVDEMARELVWAMYNPGKACAMAEAGRAVVYERYDWDVLAERLESAWRQLAPLHARADEAAQGSLAPIVPAIG